MAAPKYARDKGAPKSRSKEDRESKPKESKPKDPAKEETAVHVPVTNGTPPGKFECNTCGFLRNNSDKSDKRGLCKGCFDAVSAVKKALDKE